MKKIILALLTVSLLGSLFFSCSNSVGSSDENKKDNSTEDNGGTGTGHGSGSDSGGGTETTPVISKNIELKFDFEGAKAVALLERQRYYNGVPENDDGFGNIVKILDDGSVKNVLNAKSGISLNDIKKVIKSPLEESKDFFLVFSDESQIGYDENNNKLTIGELICVHEDGSISDILKKKDENDSTYYHMSLNKDAMMFDASGNFYFCSQVNNNGDAINKYNPETNELTQVVTNMPNTEYFEMQLDKTGQWLFAYGHAQDHSSYFLRAIPISNPNNYITIYYSTSHFIEAWKYDDKHERLYYTACYSLNEKGLYYVTKAGGFKDKTFYHKYVGEGVDDVFLDVFEYRYETYNWNDKCLTNNSFDASKVIEEILSLLPMCMDYRSTDPETKRLTKDDVDISFKKYLSEPNISSVKRAAALLTKDKKNEEALEAFNNRLGMDLLYRFFGSDDYFSFTEGKGYLHNLLADIVYLKGTDTLVIDSEEVKYTYSTEIDEDGYFFYNGDYNYLNNNPRLNKYGYYCDSGNRLFNSLINAKNAIGISQSNKNPLIIFGFSSDYYSNDGKLNSSELLNHFFSYCGPNKNFDFKLTSFKDDTEFGELYTTLKNEEALEWLASDIYKLTLLGKLVYKNTLYYSGYEQDHYVGVMSFISKTCFVKDTDIPAINWNCDTRSLDLDYFYGGYSESDFYISENGVYYDFDGRSADRPYYYLVQVADADGNFVEMVNEIKLPSGKVRKSMKNKDYILLDYSVTDSNGAELGYHHIYAVEMATGKVTNCFDSVPNRNNLEVVSFNSAGDLLYYSAVRGTAVENGIVNIVTNEYNPLDVQRKMVAVYTFD